MRDDYKMKEGTVKVQLEIEKSIAEALVKMEKYSKHTQSELTNTALKRFVTQHKDFMPPEERK